MNHSPRASSPSRGQGGGQSARMKHSPTSARPPCRRGSCSPPRAALRTTSRPRSSTSTAPRATTAERRTSGPSASSCTCCSATGSPSRRTRPRCCTRRSGRASPRCPRTCRSWRRSCSAGDLDVSPSAPRHVRDTSATRPRRRDARGVARAEVDARAGGALRVALARRRGAKVVAARRRRRRRGRRRRRRPARGPSA